MPNAQCPFVKHLRRFLSQTGGGRPQGPGRVNRPPGCRRPQSSRSLPMVTAILKRLARPQLFGPAMLADPYPYYARLRRIDPVHWAEGPGAWVLTRYADIVSALRSPHASAERTENARRRVPAEFHE